MTLPSPLRSLVLLALVWGTAACASKAPPRDATASAPEPAAAVSELEAPTASVEPAPPPPPPDPSEQVIQEADQLYLEGLEAVEREEWERARRHFDMALEVYLGVRSLVASDPRLEAEFEDLVQSIHQIEVEQSAVAQGTRLRVEDLKDISAYLSPEQAEREKTKVEEKSATVTYDFPVEINDRVVAFIDAFSGPRKKLFEPGMIRSGRYVPLIRRVFREEGVPQDLVYLSHVESAFKPQAYSRARARGLFQFIASTGRNYGLRSDWWVDMRSDPELSARASARYLKALYEVYGDWYLAMAEYNGGSRVRSAWKRSGKKADFWDLAAGRSLRSETRNYVPQILAAVILHKSPEKYGLTTEREAPIVYDTVTLNESLDLRVAARLSGTTLDSLIDLNAGLRRLATPPDYENFPLRVPPGTAAQFLVKLAELPESERLPWYRHVVRRGETLSTIAARYGASVYAIQSANSMRNPHRISIGQNLMIPGSAVRVAALGSAVPRADDGTRQVHRVGRGDTLYSIARRYRTTVGSLIAWNSISNPRLIRAGQRLVVYPGTRSEAASSTGPNTARAGGAGREREVVVYQVRRGDTLYGIARTHRVSVSALQKWNGMAGRTLIHPGTSLKIYR